MTEKLQSLRAAIGGNVRDGDTVFIGGFGQCVPFAAAREIIRQDRRQLTLCRSGADIVFDLLIAAGAVRKVIAGYVGNPGIGLAHAFRRALEHDAIEVEFWTNFAMVLRLHAGALGVPFLPAAILLEGDIPSLLPLERITCPYTGEVLAAIPALVPDVAIIHAHRADSAGNVQMRGLRGDSVEGAVASRRVIATVEEIVAPEVIRAEPELTILPAFRVDAVCHAPGGALPSYVHGLYGRDDAAYFEWDRLARDEQALFEYVDAIRASGEQGR